MTDITIPPLPQFRRPWTEDERDILKAWCRRAITEDRARRLERDFPPGGGLTECDMGDSYE